MDNKLDGASLDLERVEQEKLRAVFPECFAEGKLNVKKLLAMCGEYDDNDFEKYKFEWKGKDASLRLAQQRSMATLRPCPQESVAWDSTQNLYIEGDNLEVLKLLQTAYYRKVKMIYIDPPYNTGNDFVYEDDFADPIQRYKEITSQTTRSNPETMGRFHTNWLNMMYPRLRLAANLLRDDGVIFISIDDNEVHNLRKLCDEVFGEENFVAQLIWAAGRKNDSKYISVSHEYILCYVKNLSLLKENEITWRETKSGLEDIYKEEAYLRKTFRNDYTTMTQELKAWYKSLPNGHPAKDHKHYNRIDAKGVYFPADISWPGGGGPDYELTNPKTGIPARTPSRGWVTKKETILEWVKQGIVDFGENGSVPCLKSYLKEKEQSVPYSVFYQDGRAASKRLANLFGTKIFENPKDETIIARLINFAVSSKDAIILDFFSGSATTAHAVMQLNKEDGGNRRFIMVQLPELTDEKSEAYKAGYKNICEIGKERIRRAGRMISEEKVVSGQYLVDSEKTGDLFAEEKLTTNHSPRTTTKPDTGFRVFKLDTSNLKTWDATPLDGDDPQQMELLLDRMNTMVETIKSDRSDEDVVYELMFKMGVPPTYPVTPVEIDGKRAYCIGEECLLLVCLQEGLTAATIERMAEDYLPSKMILSEKCFADDTAMANAHYILRDREIELKLV